MTDSKIRFTKNGEEIHNHLDNVNMDAWFIIYENYIQKDPKQKSTSNISSDDTPSEDNL